MYHYSFLFAAYEILSDEEKRQQYDQFGDDAFKQGGGGGGAHFNMHDFFKHFDEAFSGFKNHGRRGRNSNANHFGFGFDFDDLFDDSEEDLNEDFGSFDTFFGGSHGFGGFDMFDGMFESFGDGGQEDYMFMGGADSRKVNSRIKTKTSTTTTTSSSRSASGKCLNKMADISLMVMFSNAFSYKNINLIWLEFHWDLFLRVNLTTIHSRWFRYQLDWCWTGDKPLPEPVMTQFTEAYMHNWISMS